MKAYFISGLGADEKVFQRIQLPGKFEPVHLGWIEPLQNESFESYAVRLSQRIDVKEDFILIGLSLGGMLAIEMNKFLQPKQTVLISSAVNGHELSKAGLLLGRTGVYKILPGKILHSVNFIISSLIGLQSREDKALAAEMVINITPRFFRWAIAQIIRWDNHFIPRQLIRMHGTADKIIPFPDSENIIPIEGGTHFMVFNKAGEINKILRNELMRIE